MEVKCSTELKELIFRSRKPKRGKAADLTIPPNPDVVEVDGKMVSPVKGEIKPVEPGVPETTGSTQSPGVPETSAPLQGSSLGLKTWITLETQITLGSWEVWETRMLQGPSPVRKSLEMLRTPMFLETLKES